MKVLVAPLSLDVLPGIRNGNFFFTASFAWVLWDWVICIDTEIEHFWKKRWTIGSILYFANRFVILGALLSHAETAWASISIMDTERVCQPLVYLLFYLAALSTAIIQTVLVLRTYALYDCSKRILWPLMALNVFGLIWQFVLISLHTNETTLIYNPFPSPYTGCICIFGTWAWKRFIPVVIFELTVFFLMLSKFFHFARIGLRSEATYILFRDGFIESIAVLVTTIFSIFVEIFQQRGGTVYQLSFDLAPTVGIICCARMLLNIRDVMTIDAPNSEEWRTRSGFHTAVHQSEETITTEDNADEVRGAVFGPSDLERGHGTLSDTMDADEKTTPEVGLTRVSRFSGVSFIGTKYEGGLERSIEHSRAPSPSLSHRRCSSPLATDGGRPRESSLVSRSIRPTYRLDIEEDLSTTGNTSLEGREEPHLTFESGALSLSASRPPQPCLPDETPGASCSTSPRSTATLTSVSPPQSQSHSRSQSHPHSHSHLHPPSHSRSHSQPLGPALFLHSAPPSHPAPSPPAHIRRPRPIIKVDVEAALAAGSASIHSAAAGGRRASGTTPTASYLSPVSLGSPNSTHTHESASAPSPSTLAPSFTLPSPRSTLYRSQTTSSTAKGKAPERGP